MADDGSQIVSFPGFRGINRSSEPHLLSDGQVPDAENLVFRTGAARTRGGFVVDGSATLARALAGNQMVLGILDFEDTHQNNENLTVVESANNDVYDPDYPQNPETGDGETSEPEDEQPDPGWTPPANPPDDSPDDTPNDILPPHDEEQLPENNTKWVLVASLPEKVYWRCDYLVTLTAEGRTGTFDGDSAVLYAVLFRDNADGVIVSEDQVDVSSGWSSNEWSSVFVAANDLGGYYPNKAAVRADTTDMKGIADTALFAVPAFVPEFVDPPVADGTHFTFRVDARDESGNVLSHYDDSGADLTVEWQNYDVAAGAWKNNVSVQEGDGTTIDLQSGWTDGAWQKDIEISSAPDKIPAFAAVIHLFDHQWRISYTFSTWEAAFSNDYLYTAADTYLRLVKFTGGGVPDADYAGSNLSFTWEKYNAGTATWESVTDAPVNADTGEALDPNSGWSDGRWQAPLDVPSYADTYSRLRVLLLESDSQVASAVGELDIDQNLKEAILERQVAAGVSSSNRIDTTADYTLAELVDHTQLAAPSFIENNAYDGGTSAPGMLTSSYAENVTDRDELYTKVIAMKLTKHSTTQSNSEARYGDDSQYISDHGDDFDTAYSVALSNAQDDYDADYESGGTADVAGVCIWDASYEQVMVRLYAIRRKYAISSLATHRSKTARYFVKAVLDVDEQFITQVSSSDVDDYFDKHGVTGGERINQTPDENNYGEWTSADLAENDSSHTTGWFGNLRQPGVPKVGGGSADTGSSRNHEISAHFALIKWDFAYV